jgi:DNA-directed RNA polymerase specialized sigma24 family protein
MPARKVASMDPQEEIVRLLAIQLRLMTKSQAMAILEMSKAGFGPSRISTLLGTTPNTVSQALADAKKASSQKQE